MGFECGQGALDGAGTGGPLSSGLGHDRASDAAVDDSGRCRWAVLGLEDSDSESHLVDLPRSEGVAAGQELLRMLGCQPSPTVESQPLPDHQQLLATTAASCSSSVVVTQQNAAVADVYRQQLPQQQPQQHQHQQQQPPPPPQQAASVFATTASGPSASPLATKLSNSLPGGLRAGATDPSRWSSPAGCWPGVVGGPPVASTAAAMSYAPYSHDNCSMAAPGAFPAANAQPALPITMSGGAAYHGDTSWLFEEQAPAAASNGGHWSSQVGGVVGAGLLQEHQQASAHMPMAPYHQLRHEATPFVPYVPVAPVAVQDCW
eukprot:CAMPEP_0178403814 /NCGR_PEP_ID=MMETSP0689_2-20121128/17563_1 /TAXON_ID=160604 /ORGANISM="Amphidinium massartii, Strain CS-259" /LENGTH=317 /DNA_ID=CAMNT_0020024781 /DNA_START=92 /DNA_END=1045 /DNA_ORIENTATION=-